MITSNTIWVHNHSIRSFRLPDSLSDTFHFSRRKLRLERNKKFLEINDSQKSLFLNNKNRYYFKADCMYLEAAKYTGDNAMNSIKNYGIDRHVIIHDEKRESEKKALSRKILMLCEGDEVRRDFVAKGQYVPQEGKTKGISIFYNSDYISDTNHIELVYNGLCFSFTIPKWERVKEAFYDRPTNIDYHKIYNNNTYRSGSSLTKIAFPVILVLERNGFEYSPTFETKYPELKSLFRNKDGKTFIKSKFSPTGLCKLTRKDLQGVDDINKIKLKV